MEPFIRRTTYKGPLKAAILDWAGTAIDYGCMAPTAVFVDVFKKFGVDVTLSEVRQFMGLMKKDHIRGMCELPSIKQRWREVHQHDPGESDVDAMYIDTEAMMIDTITRFADPIPGCLDTIAAFRSKGMKIGSCTGYTRPMMDVLIPAAKEKGYAPDAVVCSSDVAAGRPYPWMSYQLALNLEIYPFEAVVKIGDTISDIEEGLNAGMWTIGLTKSGNELGLSRSEVEALPEEELNRRLREIENRYLAAGANYVAEGIWECLPIVETINNRLANGEHPLGDLWQKDT